jgi:hypothetical protein
MAQSHIPAVYQVVIWPVLPVRQTTGSRQVHWLRILSGSPFSSTLGQAFHLVYESFQMKLGLDGNIFSRPFTKYQRLATHWWFHVLWQYCSCYSVTLHFHITATRVGNVLHIELFIREGYTGDMLESTNRVRKFYQVHPRSDVLCADGCTVDTSRALSCQPGRSTRVFSWKQLTNLDLTSASLVLPTPLGCYLQEPHIPYEWLASSDGSHLYQLIPNGYNTFTPTSTGPIMRSGVRYEKKISNSTGSPNTTHYALVSVTSPALYLFTPHAPCTHHHLTTNHSMKLYSLQQSLAVE